jgi:hypothetical protein
MKITVWIAGMLLALTLSAAGYLGYLGMFSSVTVTERQMGPYVFAYQDFIGPYSQTMRIFSDVDAMLAKEGVKAERGLGVYYDNPDLVPAQELRSRCGSVIEEKDSGKIPAVSKRLSIGSFPKSDCVVAEFPIKTGLSFVVGPVKVYPLISKYMLAKGYKTGESYELYDMPNKKTYYIMPVRKPAEAGAAESAAKTRKKTR